MRHRASRRLFFSLVWGSVLIFGVSVRLLGVSELPSEQFTEADAYLYYAHAREISVSGRLPERDMRRWLPEGRDGRQSLSLYAYAIAYTHKAVSVLRPSVSVYSVAVYLPVVCFLIGVGSLCVFLSGWKGHGTSIAVGLLLVSLPGSIERSAAGFGDRDAWCLMIGLLSGVTYLSSVLTAQRRRRLLWRLLSGFCVFLGGLSWEGFGVFVWALLLIEVWRFLTTETEEGFGLYVLWVLCFVPSLYLASEAYRSGEGWSTHLFGFLLVPPVCLGVLRGLRYLLQTGLVSDRLRRHPRGVALGLTLAGVSLGFGYVLTHFGSFGATTVALSQSALMQSIGELETPHVGYWHYRWGSLVVLGSLGFVGLYALGVWRSKGRGGKVRGLLMALLLLGVALFPVSVFLQVPLNSVWGAEGSRVVFFVSLACCLFAFLWIACRFPKNPCLSTLAPYLAFGGGWSFGCPLPEMPNATISSSVQGSPSLGLSLSRRSPGSVVSGFMGVCMSAIRFENGYRCDTYIM